MKLVVQRSPLDFHVLQGAFSHSADYKVLNVFSERLV